MWFYKGEEFTEIPANAFGFIYIITNRNNDRKYIGKKNFYFTRLKKIKGKIRKRRIKFESDWKDYWSSSEILKKDIKKLGEENFKREILHICFKKHDLSYLELREQIERNVLESFEYYNEFVYYRGRKRKPQAFQGKKMKIDDLKLKFAFTGEPSFGNFHDFISKNGTHSLNDFEHSALFTIFDPGYNQLLMNDSIYWMNFKDENEPFKLQHFKDEYILEFKSEGTTFYKMKDIIAQYWSYSKQVDCEIGIFSCSEPEKEQEEPSFDPFLASKKNRNI